MVWESSVPVLDLLREGCHLVVSEQIIECPFVLRRLRKNDKTIFDFGGFEGILPPQLSALGYRVSVLVQRRYPFSHPNLSVVCGGLFAESFQVADRFDVVVSISTIEHLGMGRYGDQVANDGDIKGAEVLWGLVKESGRLMASVPAGTPAIQRGYRVYNEKRIDEVFPNISRTYWFAKNGQEGTWSEMSARAVEDLTYEEPYGRLPIEEIAFVIWDKGG